jgi:hypothetical protein
VVFGQGCSTFVFKHFKFLYVYGNKQMDEYFSYESMCPDRTLYQKCILKKQMLHFQIGQFIPKIIVEDDFYVILFDEFNNPFGMYL